MQLKDVGLTKKDLKGKVYRPKGCPECLDTGYRGRSGIYELLHVTDDVKHLVMQSADAGSIKKAALANGLVTLRRDGLRKVLDGVTSFDEVVRVTQEEVADKG